MNKQLVKRIIAGASAAALTLILAACAGPAAPEAEAPDEIGFEAGAELSIMLPSHPSWPFREDWKVWQYLREATKLNFQITAIPSSDYTTKLTLMMADRGGFVDLVAAAGKGNVDSYAQSGALVAIDDHMDKMVNYKKYWDSVPAKEREIRLMSRRSADGKTYYPQLAGTESRQGVLSWMYRKDIFEKNAIPVPETFEQLYTAASKLKELYPDSYPLCMRNGLINLGVIGSEWKPNFTHGLYYDFDEGKWHYGAGEDTMREIVEFMRTMYTQGLVPPDYLTINSKSWEELMSTNRGFILPDYVVRVDFFNIPTRKENPEYTLAAMVPPKSSGATGQSLVNKFNVDPKGYMIMNSGDEKRINTALSFIDWLYTDEAAELVSWGKQGETWEMKDGRKQFIRPEDGDIELAYGLFNYGSYMRVMPDAAKAMASDEQAESVSLALEHTEANYNPAEWLAFPDDVLQSRDDLLTTIKTFTEERLSKFLYCQLPMSEWDSFVRELDEQGLGELLKMYEEAYNNVTGK